MNKNSPHHIIKDLHKESHYEGLADRNIPFRCIKKYLNYRNVMIILRRNDLSWNDLKFIINTLDIYGMSVISSPSFTAMIIKRLISKFIEKGTDYKYYDKLMKWFVNPCPIHYMLTSHSCCIFALKDSAASDIIANSQIQLCPRPIRFTLMKVEQFQLEDVISYTKELNSSCLPSIIYSFIDANWNYGNGYKYIYDYFFTQKDGKKIHLRTEIKGLLRICSRVSVPREIFHIIAEFFTKRLNPYVKESSSLITKYIAYKFFICIPE